MSVAPTLASNTTAQIREATRVVDALSGTHRGLHRPADIGRGAVTGLSSSLHGPVIWVTYPTLVPRTGRDTGGRNGRREGRTGTGPWYPGDGHIRPHKEWMTNIGLALGTADVAGDASMRSESWGA
jgi:hypothetical protein